MQIIESIGLAIAAIKANKMRAFLTMLGIIIGISSVITISAIGASAKGMIEETLMGTGLDYVYLQIDWTMLNDGYVDESDLIRKDEADRLKERMGEELVYYAPYVYSSAEGHYGRQKAEFNILGVAPEYTQCTTEIEMKTGRFINATDVSHCRNVLVIPDDAAGKLFGKEDAVGKVIQMENGEEFTVVGTYHRKVSSLESMLGGGSRFKAYMPYSVDGLDYVTTYLECYVNSDNAEKTGKMMADFITAVKKKPEGFYTYYSQNEELGTVNQVLDILSLAIGAIAAISLLVGGIGIMNIMLVSVTERTREIGIRKALGARTGDILWQFLIESMILSMIGGIVGIGTGIGVAAIAAKILGARLILEFRTIVIAVLFSGIVGMIFGIFPARKAAAKDPIEALRYE